MTWADFILKQVTASQYNIIEESFNNEIYLVTWRPGRPLSTDDIASDNNVMILTQIVVIMTVIILWQLAHSKSQITCCYNFNCCSHLSIFFISRWLQSHRYCTTVSHRHCVFKTSKCKLSCKYCFIVRLMAKNIPNIPSHNHLRAVNITGASDGKRGSVKKTESNFPFQRLS